MGIKEILTNLGKNNKPTYAVMAIAVVKGIARPLFTMTDKHADPETKKYTAIREGLTEVVAIPTYFACGELASKVADKLKRTSIRKTERKTKLYVLRSLYSSVSCDSCTCVSNNKTFHEKNPRE